MFNIQQQQIDSTIGVRRSSSEEGHVADFGYEALGTANESCVIYSKPLNQIVYLSPRQLSDVMSLSMYIGKNHIEDITNVDFDYIGKNDISKIGHRIIEECQNKGPFSEVQTRGRGFWLNEDGVVLVNSTHLTDVNGKIYPRRNGDYIYESAGKLDYFHDTVEADDNVGKAICDLLSTFSFIQPEVSALRLLGFIGCGFFPGVLPWRPSVMMQGPSGVGKSSLAKNVHWLLGNKISKRFTASESSVAGIIAAGGSDAGTMVLDEMEAKESTSKILAFNRNASEGINSVKGSSSGKRVIRSGRTCFIFGGINPPKMEDADSNRLVFVKLASSAKKRTQRHFLFADDYDLAKQKVLTNLGNGLCARLVRRAEELTQTAYMIKNVMLVDGYTDRICDTYSPIIASAWLALNSNKMAESDVKSFVARFAVEKTTESTSLAQNMFSTLMNSAVRTDHSVTTINYVLRDYVESMIQKNPDHAATQSNLLALYGIRVDISLNLKDLKESLLNIFVKNRHNENLLKLAPQESRESIDFDGILMQQPGAERLDKVIRIGGLATRAIRIPLTINDYYDFDDRLVREDIDFAN